MPLSNVSWLYLCGFISGSSILLHWSLYQRVYRMQGLFQWVGSSHQVAKELELQLQHQSFQWIFRLEFLQDWLVWSPCSPRDSQESSPTLQFKSINSSVLSFLYSLTLTSMHDYWKNHRFDYMNLCQQKMSLLFNTLSRFVIAFLPRSKHLIILWLQSPSGVILDPPKNKICHNFYFFTIYLPWSHGTRYYDLGFLNVEF